jgi:chemotaxis protein MotB
VKEDELRKLETSLQAKSTELEERDIILLALDADLNQKQKELEEQGKKLFELEQILHSKDSAVFALKTKITNALLGFENKGLTIQQRNGKIYVTMDEKLLFKSGKWDVDPKGQDALKQIAKVLEQNKDINIVVEGHTDDVPMKGTGDVKDNWDLSTKRATSIVKILLQSSKMDPGRITAAGRGPFQPIDGSKTPEARAKNRRTEIILTPKLDELFQILETN